MRHRESRRVGEFELVGEKEKGYALDAVDDYLAQLAADYSKLRHGEFEGVITSEMIRQVTFESESGGYRPSEVDEALDKVEERFAVLENEYRRNELGQNLWDEEIEVLAEAIMGRLNRPAGARFRRPSKRLVKGYFIRDVDDLCERLKKHLLTDQGFDPALVRQARFRSATGDMSYEETQVDAFMDRCIQLMLELR